MPFVNATGSRAFPLAWTKHMAKPDSAKEEIGWLKAVFAVLAAIDASLIAWVAQVYGSAAKLLLVLAFTGVASNGINSVDQPHGVP